MSVAAEVKERYDEGEDFAALAMEYSIDSPLKQAGGELGWYPRGALDEQLEFTAFNLDVGECSEPFLMGGTSTEQMPAVVMVSAKDESREIDERAMQALRAKAVDDWYIRESGNHTIRFYGLDNPTGYDSGTDAWVQWQLMRMQRDDERTE